jgi:hypothetical protein
VLLGIHLCSFAPGDPAASNGQVILLWS